MEPTCPLCGDDNSELLGQEPRTDFEKKYHDVIWECKTCGFCFIPGKEFDCKEVIP